MLSILCVCLSPHSQAENSALIQMFGADPGSPLPHAYSYGLPEGSATTYALRIATIDKEIKDVFYDTELTVAREGKIVSNIRASRAFRTLTACHEARDVILAKLAQGLNASGAQSSASWQYESEDGQTRGMVFCEQIRHFPMPILRLLIEHGN